MLDLFRSSNMFNVLSLTTAINKLPYAPSRLGRMGLFEEEGVSSTIVAVEERQGRLSLISTKARGDMSQGPKDRKRYTRAISVPHLPWNATVMAEEVQGIRAFGSETETESVAQVVNDKLAQLKQDHELTWEWHRVGALKGLVLDADGTTELYDLFEIFGISQTTYTLDMSSSGDNIKLFAQDVTRTIEDALGADTFTGIHCFCGNDFWDNLISSDEVKEAFDRWRDGQFFREQQRAIGGGGGFEYAGIWWENYRGSIGNQKFFDDDKAQIFPTGVKNLFKRYNAPANFMETVNTRGKALYAKQEVMKFDVGVEIHTQSNPLHICTRPSVLIEVTDTTPIES